MKSITFMEENEQIPLKSHRLSFSLFILFIMIVSLLSVMYICSNITLMKLGYQSLELEKKKDEILVQKYQLESSVENLSSLTRIEKIAVYELGMCQPERIEFIAMLPKEVDFNLPLEQTAELKSDNTFIEAGGFLKEFANLNIFQNQ